MADEILDNGNQSQQTTQGIASTVHPDGVKPDQPQGEQKQQEQTTTTTTAAEPEKKAEPALDLSKPLSLDAPEIVPVTFEPTGDPTLDIINDYVGSKGIGPDSAEYKAAAAGDFGPLTEKLKSLGDKAKGFERYVQAAENHLQQTKAAHEAKHGDTIKACHALADEVGGWDSLCDWVRANATPEELAEINEALGIGGIAAREVTAKLVKLRAANPDKAKPEGGANPVKEHASTVKDATGGALSPVDFQKEIGRLMDKYGSNYVYQAEYRDAQRRRNAFRG